MIIKTKKAGLAFLAGVMIFSFISCNWTKKYEEEEREKIQKYLTDHPNDTFELKPSGLYYKDVIIGTGKLAETKDTAYVLFTLYDISGKKLLSNIGGDTIVNPVNEGFFITGFDEALTYMREGGKSKVIIPSNLAYGDYTPLVYDIYLVKLVPDPGTGKK
jgi:FKBP-type peptidyl-prolyl cis-trans isomerase